MSTPKDLTLPDAVTATTLHTDRGEFSALTAGDGTSGHVVLVPGWTGSKEDFVPILPMLADAGFGVISYDQRGQFETPGAPDDDYSMAGFAADAAAVAATTGAATTHLLGHSFGGLVAQQAAVDDPVRWRTVSLLCSGPGALGETPERRLSDIVAALDGGVSGRDMALAMNPDLDPDSNPIDAFVVDKFDRTSTACLAAMTRHLIDTPDLTDAVAATGLPCWVGRGVDDEAWPHEDQDDQARRLGTRTQVVPSSAHSPAIENPSGLIAAWLPFLTAS